MSAAVELPAPQPKVRDRDCPLWCKGHNETFNPWEDLQPGRIRMHSTEETTVEEQAADLGMTSPGRRVSVAVTAEEVAEQAVSRAWVEVATAEDASDLTPQNARILADLLLSAADVAEGLEPRTSAERERNAFELGRDYEAGGPR